jgi:hypothetical protein
VAVTIVQYRTRAERTDENQELIERVFAELATTRPAHLRYASFRLGDGVSFVHVADIDTDDGSNPLTDTAAFVEFLREIDDRCDEGPDAAPATLVGGYGFGSDWESAHG